jgi:hypothetical protein
MRHPRRAERKQVFSTVMQGEAPAEPARSKAEAELPHSKAAKGAARMSIFDFPFSIFEFRVRSNYA